MRKSSQVFYSAKSALEIELSKNGIFFTIAPFKEKKDGFLCYNWKEKAISKISISELCHLLEGLKYFRDTPETYVFYAQKLFGKNYQNYQFCHKNKKGQIIMVGWQLFTLKSKDNCNNRNAEIEEDVRLQYVIKPQGGQQCFFTIQKQDIARLQAYLEYIKNQSFYYSDLLQEQEIIEFQEKNKRG
jgi:hypothetical protein